MKDFNAECTGNRIVINCAPIKDVLQLKKVIASEIKKNPLGFKLKGDNELLVDKEIDLANILEFVKNTLLSIDSSDEFDEAIYNCLRVCTYKTTYRIDKDLFDNPQIPEAREDYYEIILSCIEENLRPFLKSLISMWKTRVQNGNFAQLLSLQ